MPPPAPGVAARGFPAPRRSVVRSPHAGLRAAALDRRRTRVRPAARAARGTPQRRARAGGRLARAGRRKPALARRAGARGDHGGTGRHRVRAARLRGPVDSQLHSIDGRAARLRRIQPRHRTPRLAGRGLHPREAAAGRRADRGAPARYARRRRRCVLDRAALHVRHDAVVESVEEARRQHAANPDRSAHGQRGLLRRARPTRC